MMVATGEPVVGGGGENEYQLLEKGECINVEKKKETCKELTLQWSAFVVIILLSIHAMFQMKSVYSNNDYKILTKPFIEEVLVVWSSAWIAAVASGLGMVPFFFVKTMSDKVVALCNAVAAGVMIAASVGLAAEGAMGESTPDTAYVPALTVLVGGYLGVFFIKLSEHFIGEVDAEDVAKMDPKDMRRVLVVLTALTVHAFSEGVGIGVSYHTENMGGLVSATLAIHNIPEGLAVGIVLIPRGFSKLSTFLCCVLSSIGQPLMAVPAFIFVPGFVGIGYGFAAGAMVYVALYELMVEAEEHLSSLRTYCITFLSMLVMGLIQIYARDTFVNQE